MRGYARFNILHDFKKYAFLKFKRSFLITHLRYIIRRNPESSAKFYLIFRERSGGLGKIIRNGLKEGFVKRKKLIHKKNAPTGSRTRVSCLEGSDLTVRPLVRSYKY